MWRSDGESRVATIHNSLSLMTLMVVLKEPHPNRLTLENLLMPVRSVNRTCASLSLITPYSPRR